MPGAYSAATMHPPAPRRVADCHLPLPLHDTLRTRAIEARALQATPPHELMARAGLATARLALAVAPHARRITVLAGPGNNGGDGLIAALHLRRLGRQVRLLHLADLQRLPADAADAWRRARDADLQWIDGTADLHDDDLLIDALLGIGAARAPEGAIADTIARATASGRPVLAVDQPSGLHADSGRLLGEQAIVARWTLALLTLKPGLVTAAGRDHAGELWFDDLGVGADEPPVAWLGAACEGPVDGFASRRHGQHKGSFGDLVVVGGAPGMQGAALLAARAALTAGAGRVYLSPLDTDAAPPAAGELMHRPRAWEEPAARLQAATVVCGCGGGAAVAATLPALIEHAGRLLLDADALNAVATDASLQALLRDRGARGGVTVLTPHPLEAARLLGTSSAGVQADRLDAARQLAATPGTVALLKGSGSVVAAAGRTPWINGSGNARLATPGSGDVLAGWIGGLWAGRPAGVDGAWAAACAATWLHGRAADISPGSPRLPLRAADLVDRMAEALPAA